MRIRIFILLLITALLASCSVTKFVPEGEYLLDKVKVKCDTNALGVNPSEMRQLVRQRGNSRWFSAAKLPSPVVRFCQYEGFNGNATDAVAEYGLSARLCRCV